MWLLTLALLGSSGALAPAAGAASTQSLAGATAAGPSPGRSLATAAGPSRAQSVASVTAATTGLPDASSVVALNVCGSPSALVAACLARTLGIRGTRTFVHPRLRQPASPNRLSRLHRPSNSASPTVAIPAAAAPPQPGTPAYLQQAYDLAYLSQTAGSGATIGIVDAYDDPNAEADMSAYRSEFGLTPCTTANGCFTKLDQTGGQNYPATNLAWRIEISLDLDAVSAVCPRCHIVLVEASTSKPADLAAAQATAGTFPGVSVISDSWAVALSSNTDVQNFENYGPYTFRGVTTVAASGDDGYLGASTNDYPAALTNVAAAGGTTLIPASGSGLQSPRGFDESAWSGAGSGCDLSVTKPAWETDVASCSGRSYSDLSADADPLTAMQVYDSADNGWLVVGGTSEASPMIAAYYALVGSAARGPSWAYAHSALLNDPTTGSNSGANGSCVKPILYICNAGTGYDGPTGVGSISGAVTPGAPGIGGPGPNGSYTQSVTADTAQLQGGVYPNGSDTTYWWDYGTTTSYGQQSPAKDIGAGTAPLAVADTLTGLQESTTYHYRLVAENSFGSQYGYDYTLTTAAAATTTTGQNQGTGTTPTPPATPPATNPVTTPPLSTPPTTGSTNAGSAAPALTGLRVASASATTATISSAVSTGGAATTYTLQFGTTRALGRSSRGALAASATGLVSTLGNLAPGRTYYVRAVVSNARGSSTSPTIRFRTSPVTITRLAFRGNQLQAVLRCHGSASCRVRLQARSRSRLVAVGQATVRGNRSATAIVTLSRGFIASLANGRRQTVKLSVLSSWNGYPATVTATISFR